MPDDAQPTPPSAQPLLERGAQLAAVHAALAAGRGGRGALLVLGGSAGIGKTRVLAEAAAAARAADFVVLAARGGELERGFAFGVVRQLFELHLAGVGEAGRAELLGGAAALTAPLLGNTAEPLFDEGPDGAFAMLHGLYWLAANIALAQPTMIIVDDLHWADEPSQRWLSYLARRLEGLPLVVLLATRPPEQTAASAFVEELLAEPTGVVLPIAGLGVTSAETLIRDRLGVAPDEAFTRALHEASGGNPLFLAALLDTIGRAGLTPTVEQAGGLAELASEAVSRSVAVRLARLPTEATATVRAAAILGDGTPLATVAALLGLDGDSTLRAGAALVGEGLLAREDPVEFEHPVVRTAVLSRMAVNERRNAHRRAAEVLLEHGAPVEQAAGHLLDALPAGDAFVVGTLVRAAGRATAQGASDAAVTYLRRALAEPPAAAGRADVLQALAVAELTAGGEPDVALERLREALEDLERVRRPTDLALTVARSLIVVGRHAQALAMLRAIDTRLRDLDAHGQSRLEGHLIIAAQQDPELRPFAEELVAAAGAQRSLAAIHLSALANEEVRTGGSCDRALALAARSLVDIERDDEMLVYLHAFFAQTLAGAEDDAAAGYATAIERARSRGAVLDLAVHGVFRASLRLRRGELLAAEEDLRPTGRLAEPDAPTFRMYRAAFLGEVLLERGELAGAEEVLREPFGSLGMGHQIFLLHASGRVDLAAGRPERALDGFLAAGTIAEAVGIANPAWAPWRSSAALALHRLGRVAEAREHADVALTAARRWGAPATVGIALRTSGLVEGGPEGLALLAEGVTTLAGSGARLEHARALVEHGAALRRANRRTEAREQLRAGVALAQSCAGALVAGQGNDELAATGARPRTLTVTGRDELTASERRVAQLAIEERSNKEIAQALFVTVKTVEVHLSRVYRKLDISSRRQLHAELVTGAAARAGAGG